MELRYDGGEITKIKVIGIGGGGNNTIDRMVEANLQGAEFIAMNTDLQQLNRSKAPVKLQLGAKATLGRGCGAKPERGRKSAEEKQSGDYRTAQRHGHGLHHSRHGRRNGDGRCACRR